MMNFLDSKIIKLFLPLWILFIAFALRVYGINWDQNQHLHPDERFLTMTVGAMTWPTTLSEYLDPDLSKLNPYNNGTGFYVYGTLPTTLVKYISNYEIFDQYQYNNIALTGRMLSAFFDVGVVLILYLISKDLFGKKTALLSSFLYAVSVLPIQLSHFFAVDTFLNFFLVLSFYFLTKMISEKKYYYSILLGFSFGAALSCKISALYFLPVILLGYFYYFLRSRSFLYTLFLILYTTFFAFVAFRILDPHIFSGGLWNPILNPQFIQNIKELKQMGAIGSLFPPAIQWYKTTPILFPLKNIILWGLGLPLGILSIAAVIQNIYNVFFSVLKSNIFSSPKYYLDRLTDGKFNIFLILLWVFFLFIYQGIQYTPSMRYFLPIYPFFAIISAEFSIRYVFPLFKKNYILYSIFYILILLWPLSFLSIYSRPHSRVIASEWIYQNIPAGATISCDLWDDCLPLPLNTSYPGQYKIITMEPFALDNERKIAIFENQLTQIDYLILSSNRAWGSIPKVPEKFPYMTKFYKDLFEGKLNFVKVAEITSYPTIPILNIPIPDQSSEEAFTVYDHPKILIYKRSTFSLPQ